MNNQQPFSVLHVLKYKSWSTLRGLDGHLSRISNPPNVDKKRTKFNRVIIGSRNLSEDTKRLLNKKNISKLRKNGVLAIEVILSFSQSFIMNNDGSYKEGANENFREWVKASKQWLSDEFGDNCIHAALHLDETTPHLHAVVIPVAERISKSGKKIVNLNARGITGGKDKLSAMQDRYAMAVEHLGIKRGRKGRKAKRVTLEQYYSALNESKALCDKTGVIPPTSDPASFNSWQAIVRKVSDALECQHNAEIDKLKEMVRELVETNDKLKRELDSSQRKLNHRR